ncbi:PREDICTED: dual specificity protein phosphatase 1B-like, partial [Papilio polytes]|uniref:dual specificity protein phosphatase 1B-like n=1 Tax=Papilio polytes TaxID=76194 RepID=UPI0006764351
LVMLRSAIVAAFLSIPNPVLAFNGLRSWSRRVVYEKIDLCTQSCYSQIVPGLYLSNAKAAVDADVIRALNITHVLTIETHRIPKSAFPNPHVATLFIRAYDSPHTNLLPYFPMANAFIDEGLHRGNVLVHCHFGVSRSATIVIAYLMAKYQLTFEEAYSYVRNRRRFINPNPGFISQLKEYERMNYDVNSFLRLEAYLNVKAREHKYKIASVTAIFVGILVPLAVLIA